MYGRCFHHLLLASSPNTPHTGQMIAVVTQWHWQRQWYWQCQRWSFRPAQDSKLQRARSHNRSKTRSKTTQMFSIRFTNQVWGCCGHHSYRTESLLIMDGSSCVCLRDWSKTVQLQVNHLRTQLAENKFETSLGTETPFWDKLTKVRNYLAYIDVNVTNQH